MTMDKEEVVRRLFAGAVSYRFILNVLYGRDPDSVAFDIADYAEDELLKPAWRFLRKYYGVLVVPSDAWRFVRLNAKANTDDVWGLMRETLVNVCGFDDDRVRALLYKYSIDQRDALECAGRIRKSLDELVGEARGLGLVFDELSRSRGSWLESYCKE